MCWFPNSGLWLLSSIEAHWSYISHTTSQVASTASASLLPDQLTDLPVSAPVLCGRSPQPVLRDARSSSWLPLALLGETFNTTEILVRVFPQDDCVLFLHSSNSLCLDSLSVLFLGPTKTDLFCLSRSATETPCCSRTRRGEGHSEGICLIPPPPPRHPPPCCRKLLTTEQLLCLLLDSRARQIGEHVCVSRTQVICS